MRLLIGNAALNIAIQLPHEIYKIAFGVMFFLNAGCPSFRGINVSTSQSINLVMTYH